jgi:hypothetical protein
MNPQSGPIFKAWGLLFCQYLLFESISNSAIITVIPSSVIVTLTELMSIKAFDLA